MSKVITECKLEPEFLAELKTLGKIVGVAIISPEGKIISMPAPNRHHNIIRFMANTLGFPTPIDGQQGFITEDGSFVDRVSAKYIASWYKQLLPRASKSDELFSECVW